MCGVGLLGTRSDGADGLVEPESSPSAIAIRRCVERKRRELVVAARMLAAANIEMLERAPKIVAGLGSMDDCVLAGRLGAPQPAWSAKQLEQRGQLYARLAEAENYRHAGDREARRAALHEAAELAQQLDDPSLRAEVDQRLGHMAIEDGDTDAGLAQVEGAYFAAVEAGDELLAADTASLLVFLAGARGNDPERGQGWVEHARALFNKLDVDTRRRARLSAHQGAVADIAGDAHGSLEHYRRAVALVEGDPDASELLMVALNGVAIALEVSGNPKAALATYAQLEPILRLEYGPRHPSYAALANNIGAAHQAVGEFEQAIELHEQARSIADAQGNERLEMSALTNLCFAHDSARHGELGLARCRAAVALCEGMFPDARSRCGSTYMGLGNTLASVGAGEEALAAYRAVFDGYAEVHEPDDPLMAWAWSSLGAGHVAVEDWAEANRTYERAHELALAGEFPASEIAEIQFGLAQAKHGLGEPTRAYALAHAAANAYRAGGFELAAAEVDAWLDTHESP